MVKLFVGGVRRGQISDEDLRTAFEEYGEVTEAVVLSEFGFVHMTNDDDAQAAIDGLKGAVVKGATLDVTWSKGSGSRNRNERSSRPSRGGRGDRRGGRGGWGPPPHGGPYPRYPPPHPYYYPPHDYYRRDYDYYYPPAPHMYHRGDYPPPPPPPSRHRDPYDPYMYAPPPPPPPARRSNADMPYYEYNRRSPHSQDIERGDSHYSDHKSSYSTPPDYVGSGYQKF